MARFMDFEYRYIDSELFLEKGICINKYLGSETSVIVPTQIDDLPVISIGDKAFCFCNSLESITIPNSVTSIGEGAFNGCTNLESITIPDSLTFIGDEAFSGCESLSITFHESMKNTFLLDSIDETGDYDEI